MSCIISPRKVYLITQRNKLSNDRKFRNLSRLPSIHYRTDRIRTCKALLQPILSGPGLTISHTVLQCIRLDSNQQCSLLRVEGLNLLPSTIRPRMRIGPAGFEPAMFTPTSLRSKRSGFDQLATQSCYKVYPAGFEPAMFTPTSPRPQRGGFDQAPHTDTRFGKVLREKGLARVSF